MWAAILPALLATGANAQVTATFPNGVTNPEKPEFYPVGAQVNQTSMSRLLSLNGVDDFCIYGPPEPGPDSLIGNVEPIVVAYCTKPRNNARLIPDGAITAAHFVKTPLYVQVHGFWDGTQVNIPAGDDGGELDPHGEKNLGNPIGGNVTTDVATGSDVFYEEWMSFVSYDQFCLRICTAEDAANGVTAALQCEHELDIMGCAWVMAIENFYRTNNTFSECEGEPAAPPGLYVTGGVTSTFRQRYTGSWSDDQGGKGKFTVGQTVTPSVPAFYPKQSNCHTYSTISNGVDFANLMVTAAPTVLKSGSPAAVTGLGSTSHANPTTPTAVPPKPTALPSQDPNAPNPPADGSTPSQGGNSNGNGNANAETSGNTAGTTNTPGNSAGRVAVSAGVLAGALVGALAVF